MSSKPGFTQISPQSDFTATCPTCGAEAKTIGWTVPGLWTLAELKCGGCGRVFFQDLPYALGVVTPCVLDPATGKASSIHSGEWYATQAAAGWERRISRNVSVLALRNPTRKQACLINCLHPAWGDAVSNLLRVNQLRKSDIDIIVLINPGLEWLVPDYVQGIWVVDQDVLKNDQWNETLSSTLKSMVESLGLELFLPLTFQHAYLTPDEVYEASKLRPFPRQEWNQRLQEKPTVTFMWRRDVARTWSKRYVRKSESFIEPYLKRIKRKFPVLYKFPPKSLARAQQVRNIRALAEELRKVFPKLEFAVCGIGKEGKLPSWIKDLRTDTFAKDTNQIWCSQAARSHVLCGVHGSHLSLPGCFSGSYVELIPNHKLANILTLAPITAREPRNALFVYRFLPVSVDPLYLSDVIASIMLNYSYVHVAYKDAYYTPFSLEALQAIRQALNERRSAISAIDQVHRGRLGN